MAAQEAISEVQVHPILSLTPCAPVVAYYGKCPKRGRSYSLTLVANVVIAGLSSPGSKALIWRSRISL